MVAWSRMPQSTPPSTTPNAPNDNRMAGQVKAVAILNLVFAALSLLSAVALVFGLGVANAAVENEGEPNGAPEWVADMLASLAVIFGVLAGLLAVLHAAAGFQLLNYRASGKSLGIAAAVVLLVVNIPLAFGGIGLIGLGVAIYMLVVLTRPDTDALLTA